MIGTDDGGAAMRFFESRDARFGLDAQLRIGVARVAVATIELDRLVLVAELLVGLGEVVEQGRDLPQRVRALEQLDGACVVGGAIRGRSVGGEALDPLRGGVLGGNRRQGRKR